MRKCMHKLNPEWGVCWFHRFIQGDDEAYAVIETKSGEVKECSASSVMFSDHPESDGLCEWKEDDIDCKWDTA